MTLLYAGLWPLGKGNGLHEASQRARLSQLVGTLPMALPASRPA